jgi:hypothetical protein
MFFESDSFQVGIQFGIGLLFIIIILIAKKQGGLAQFLQKS